MDKSGDGTNKEINESIKYYDAFIKDVENNLMSKDYKTTKIDNGEDEIIISEKTPKMKITISNTQNQNNNADKNISTINLEQCASLLRKFYNLSENEILYIQKIEVIQEGMKIPKIEYNIYGKLSGDYLKKLNTSVCRNTTIYLSLPLIISGNIDEYNSSSGYYNNICYIKTTESGTDISLKDRKNEYINKAICQDDCELFNYNYSTTKANCSCQFKESSSSFVDIKINKTKLYKNFKNIKNIANLNFLGCYQILFSKEGIIKNIGNYINLSIIILHIISIFIFYTKQFKIINDKLKDILFGLKNLYLLNSENKKIINKKKKIKFKENKEEYKKSNTLFKVINKDKKKKKNKEKNKNEDNNRIILSTHNNNKKAKKTIGLNINEVNKNKNYFTTSNNNNKIKKINHIRKKKTNRT